MSATPQPQYPGGQRPPAVTTNPADFDADLQSLEMAKDLLKGLDKPSEITKNFAARKALYTALNHTKDNPTGYDSTLRLALYASYEKSSLNVDAKLFNSFMAFLMKPKMIIQGLPSGQPQQAEPGFLSRAFGRLTGKSQPQPAGQAQQ
jgi:hypothetical protein